MAYLVSQYRVDNKRTWALALKSATSLSEGAEPVKETEMEQPEEGGTR